MATPAWQRKEGKSPTGGDTMPKAHKINKQVAQTMKEVGI